MTTKKKSLALDEDVTDVLGAIRKSIGEDGAQILGSAAMALKIRGVVSTRSPSLDLAIGRGGVPLGRLTILWAPEGVGKTTLALNLCAQVQALGGLAFYQDQEYKLDPDYAKKLGVKTKRLIISQSSCLEKVLEGQHAVIEAVSRRRKETGERRPVVIVLDSINACIPKAVLEGSTEDHFVGVAARKWSEQLPKIIQAASKEDVALVYISQIRKKIGVMFGSPDTIAGGEAPKFYASLVLKMWREGSSKDAKGQRIGNKVGVECVKNQIAPPFQKAYSEVRYGVGFVRESALLEALMTAGIVEHRSGQMWLGDEKIGKGKRSAGEYVAEHYAELEARLRSHAGWDSETAA